MRNTFYPLAIVLATALAVIGPIPIVHNQPNASNRNARRLLKKQSRRMQ